MARGKHLVEARYGCTACHGGNFGGGQLGRGNILNPIQGATIQFNWNSPIRLSPHNTATMYLGGRSLYISRNRGETWTTTKELGKGLDLNQRSIMGVKYDTPGCGRGAGPGVPCILSKNDGYVANEYGTMTEMAESPVLPGILWAGTDDSQKFLIIWIGTFFQQVLMVMDVVKRVPPDFVGLGRTLGLSEGRIVRTIVLPCALPGIWDTLRISLGWDSGAGDIERLIEAWRDLYIRVNSSDMVRARAA